MAIKIKNSTVIDDDRIFYIGSGTTAERPVSPVEGMLRFNTDLETYEIYRTEWNSIVGTQLSDFQYFFNDNAQSKISFNGDIVLQSTYPNEFAKIGLLPDSVTWTVQTSGTSRDILALTYGNGLYVYAGQTGFDDPDNGVIFTSTDAITWTARTSGAIDTNIRALAYGNGIFVYGGDSDGSSGVLGTSTDGITWTVRTSGVGDENIRSMIYADGLFVLGANDGRISTSTDGITWTARTSGTNQNILALTYGNGLYVYGGNSLATSTDAITWTLRSTGIGVVINALTYGNGLYVCAGNLGRIRTSTDAITWTAVTSGTTGSILALDYINDLYIYGEQNLNIGISKNTIDWYRIEIESSFREVRSIINNNELFVLAGDGGKLFTNTPYSYDTATEFRMPNLTTNLDDNTVLNYDAALYINT